MDLREATMGDWVKIETDLEGDWGEAGGDEYYLNFANVATVHLYARTDEHGRHRQHMVAVTTTAGATVTLRGEDARDQLRRELDRRRPATEASSPGEQLGLRLP
jgi:hypothetical protein